MAIAVLTDAFLTVATIDLSDHLKSLACTYTANTVDLTPMPLMDAVNGPGLRSWSFEAQFFQDYAAGKVDATLFPKVGTSVALGMRPTIAIQSATNPTLSGNAILTSYIPLGGSHGEALMTTATFTGTGPLTRTAV